MVDIGCGRDLTQKADIAKLRRWIQKAAKPIMFMTANGRTQAKGVVDLFANEFDETTFLTSPWRARPPPCPFGGVRPYPLLEVGC